MTNKPLYETEFELGNHPEWFANKGMTRPGDHGVTSIDAKVTVHFRKIKDELLDRIDHYPIVVGCVAWLTDFEVINALSKRTVSIILQKEDLFRADMGSEPSHKSALRAAYDKVPNSFCFDYMPNDTPLGVLSNCWGFYTENYHQGLLGLSRHRFEAFRCVGNYNSQRSSAFPRMHNKFLVFCEEDHDHEQYRPIEVWTGSYNVSKTARYGFENCVSIISSEIAMAYLKEYCDIAVLSEPLDWSHEWIAPEYGLDVS